MKHKFSGESEISTTDIVQFYLLEEPSLSRATIDWRIYLLTQGNILYRLSRGRYALSDLRKQSFQPKIESSLKAIYGKIKPHLPYVNFIVWPTKWLSEFMLHQPRKFVTIVEVEKEATESIFQLLRNQKLNVFISPGQEVIDNYLYTVQNPVIVKRLISESPTQEIENINTVTLEKILLDLLSDVNLFSTYQGTELSRIYESAFETYNVNLSKMHRYAARRSKTRELEVLIAKTKKRQ